MFNATELAFFLIDNILEGIVIFNETLDTIYANKNAEEYLGLSHHELIAKNCNELLKGIFYKENGIIQLAIKTNKVVDSTIKINGNNYSCTAFAFRGLNNEESNRILLIKSPSSLGSNNQQATMPAETSKLIKENVSARELGEKIVKNIEDLAEAKNIPVNLLIGPLVKNLYISRDKMEFAIMNLLSKAINFSDKGSITLNIKERETGNSNIIQIINIDEKIKKKEYETLVNSFSKSADKAKNIVEQHGGKLWIDSSKGFAITFSIPKNLL